MRRVGLAIAFSLMLANAAWGENTLQLNPIVTVAPNACLDTNNRAVLCPASSTHCDLVELLTTSRDWAAMSDPSNDTIRPQIAFRIEMSCSSAACLRQRADVAEVEEREAARRHQVQMRWRRAVEACTGPR